MKNLILLAAGVACGICPSAFSGPLTTAHITKVINDVQLIEPTSAARTASVNDVVRDQVSVKTGVKSRSELRFEDDTLTRVGAETIFRFVAGTRDMSLDRGTMLLQVPKNLGGATIHTAAVTASITGTTIMLEHQPHRDIKVLVLEGSLRLAVNGRPGESVLLTPGKMVIMPPDAKHIPTPVNVDLASVMKTSTLVNMGGKDAKLPSESLIDDAVAQQQDAKGKSELVDTRYAISGSGSKAHGPADVLDLVDEHGRNLALGLDAHGNPTGGDHGLHGGGGNGGDDGSGNGGDDGGGHGGSDDGGHDDGGHDDGDGDGDGGQSHHHGHGGGH